MFEHGGVRGPDTGYRRKLSGVGAQQVAQASKSRTEGARSDRADAREGQDNLHLLLRLSGPVPSCLCTMGRVPNTSMRFSDLALFCRGIAIAPSYLPL